jgi:uncharacterized protein VirK/YbjX
LECAFGFDFQDASSLLHFRCVIMTTFEAAIPGDHSLLGNLKKASIFDALRLASSSVWNVRAIAPLLLSPRGSSLNKVVKAHPEIFKYVVKPFLAANWDVRTRFDRIVDHCETVDAIGCLPDVQTGEVFDIITLDVIDPRYRISLDQPHWLLNEGLLAISLWDGVDRMFHLGFCLSSHDGRRVAYVGGIQGRREDDALGRYREFTKSASGMRPRDFIVELFKALCRTLDVVEIRAVSDANYYLTEWLTAASAVSKDEIKISYDEVWRQRGGIYDGNGFFILPVASIRRADQDIPSKKKKMYRTRYAMLDQIEVELAGDLKSEIVGAV